MFLYSLTNRKNMTMRWKNWCVCVCLRGVNMYMCLVLLFIFYNVKSKPLKMFACPTQQTIWLVEMCVAHDRFHTNGTRENGTFPTPTDI